MAQAIVYRREDGLARNGGTRNPVDPIRSTSLYDEGRQLLDGMRTDPLGLRVLANLDGGDLSLASGPRHKG